ncbi:MAG TPA: Fe-S protein assembly co-chaperone HscB [Bryobacteraceae bacterium]|nr:Fe-S protein assembly co-chaperone HscB [Bryobacteraceae bacterium]
MNSAPTLTQDYFGFFGLPPKLTLNSADLQTRFYSLSRQFHPDRFARRAPAEQEYALNATALLNDAYRVLRDPIQRAEYLLAQQGFDIGEQRSNDVPPELLEEVFELNMLLEESPSKEELEAARTKFHRMMAAIDGELQSLFHQYDATAGDKSVLQRIRGVLNRRRYVQNLVRDVEKAIA